METPGLRKTAENSGRNRRNGANVLAFWRRGQRRPAHHRSSWLYASWGGTADHLPADVYHWRRAVAVRMEDGAVPVAEAWVEARAWVLRHPRVTFPRGHFRAPQTRDHRDRLLQRRARGLHLAASDPGAWPRSWSNRRLLQLLGEEERDTAPRNFSCRWG
jgi:hypothetical protein